MIAVGVTPQEFERIKTLSDQCQRARLQQTTPWPDDVWMTGLREILGERFPEDLIATGIAVPIHIVDASPKG